MELESKVEVGAMACAEDTEVAGDVAEAVARDTGIAEAGDAADEARDTSIAEAGDAAEEAEDTDEEAGDAAEAVDEATRDTSIVEDQADTFAKVLVRTLALSNRCSYNFGAAWHGLVFESRQSGVQRLLIG